MHRLFVALRPPLPVRQRLSAAMSGVPGARWQDDEQLHLTLRFIGEVDRHRAEDIAASLATIAGETPLVSLCGVGRFTARGRTNALWAGLAPAEALAALHRKVDRAVVRAGGEPDHRAFLPHITLARLSRGADAEPAVARWLHDHAALASPVFALDHIVLYESHLGHGGARYEAVARWPLDRPAG